MSERLQLTIQNELGLHARAAAALVKTANRFKSDILISREKMKVNGKSIMGVLMLAAAKGMKIEVMANGEDAGEALKAISDLVNDKFGEGR